jgi:phosphoenolpyruvate synthase/pyruvate phosphate dikinase
MLESRPCPCPCPMIPFHGLTGSGGMDRPPAPDRKPDELMGFSGFPGIAVETGRVVREVAVAGKLNPGDILVTEQTRPSWTLLVARAAALVTDGDGFMSHSAVGTREYGIPAVVGSGTATAVSGTDR